MAQEAKLRADQIEGLRELISQIILEERDKLIPISLLQDVEEIKRSPVGAVIRMEGSIERLGKGLTALERRVAHLEEKVATKEELVALREEVKGLATKEELAALERLMEARFQGMDERFHQTSTRINATFGILATLIIGVLIKLFLG